MRIRSRFKPQQFGLAVKTWAFVRDCPITPDFDRIRLDADSIRRYLSHKIVTTMENMPKLENWIPDSSEYINPHEVNILLCNKRVYVDVFFPGHNSSKVFSVYLTNKFKTDRAFVKLLNIRRKQDLDSIDFLQLYQLYEQGIMKVGCDMEWGYLVFHREGNKTVVYDNEQKVCTMVAKLFTTPQEFLNYTFEHFDKMDRVLDY